MSDKDENNIKVYCQKGRKVYTVKNLPTMMILTRSMYVGIERLFNKEVLERFAINMYKSEENLPEGCR
jgi:hypothetical protein